MSKRPCVLALSWDGKMSLIDMSTESLQAGDSLSGYAGTQLLRSRPDECERLAASLNFIACNALGREIIDAQYRDIWLRDHLGRALERSYSKGALLCNPWQKVLEQSVKRIYALAPSREKEIETPPQNKKRSP